MLTREAVVSATEGWYPIIHAAIDATPDEALHATEAWDIAPLGRWCDGRAVLVGDAAHATTPFAAMGACMAISDAAMLDGLLAERPRLADALGDYEAAMKKGEEAGVRHARRTARMSQAGKVIARMRDGLLAHTPPERVRAIAADTVAGR